MMYKSLLLAGSFFALPLFAQEVPAPEQDACPAPAAEGKGPGPKHGMNPLRARLAHKLVVDKYDADKDGKLSESEREVAKKDAEALRKERHEKRLQKLDKDGDGKLSDEEKEAGRPPHAGKGPRKGPHAGKGEGRGEGKGKGEGKPRPPRFMMILGEALILEKYDVDKDGKLSDSEREAMRADAKALKPAANEKEAVVEEIDVEESV